MVGEYVDASVAKCCIEGFPRRSILIATRGKLGRNARAAVPHPVFQVFHEFTLVGRAGRKTPEFQVFHEFTLVGRAGPKTEHPSEMVSSRVWNPFQKFY